MESEPLLSKLEMARISAREELESLSKLSDELRHMVYLQHKFRISLDTSLDLLIKRLGIICKSLEDAAKLDKMKNKDG